MRSFAALLLALLLAACGSSPPTRFYMLDPVPSARAPLPDPGPPVQIGHVSIPGPLDRLSFVTRSGPNRIDVSDQDRWAAPLDGMIARVVAADLAARLPADRVLAPGDPTPQSRSLTVVLNIRQFVGDTAGKVVLDVDWSVLDRQQHPRLTQRASITRQAASGQAGAIAAAMSDALGELSDRIAATLAGLR